MVRLTIFVSSVVLLLGIGTSAEATNPSANINHGDSKPLKGGKALLHKKGSLVEAHHKSHTGAHHKSHTGYQVRVSMEGNPITAQAPPSARVATRNANQELLSTIRSNVEVVVITFITFVGGALLALLLAYCLWGGETPKNQGLPPLHGRGGFPYTAAFPKKVTHDNTIANMPYDLGNVYTGSKMHHLQHHQQFQPMHPGMDMGQNFVSASPQCIPPISTTRY